MKSYAQYCGVARALDVVGDRWSLLIVRELLTRGPSRYSDLRLHLPGIATNVLASRLKELESAGVIMRTFSAPPAPAALFALTERGQALEPVLMAVAEWGDPLLLKPAKADAVRTHWLTLPARLHLKDHAPWSAPVTIAVRTGDATMIVEAEGGNVRVRMGDPAHAHATLTGSPHLVVGVLSGGMTLADAAAWGLRFEGDATALRRVQPKAGDGSGQRALFPE